MSLIIRKAADDLYTAEATPPHVMAPWSTSEPTRGRQLVNELRKRGCHERDIGDAIYEQDRNWVEKLK